MSRPRVFLMVLENQTSRSVMGRLNIEHHKFITKSKTFKLSTDFRVKREFKIKTKGINLASLLAIKTIASKRFTKLTKNNL